MCFSQIKFDAQRKVEEERRRREMVRVHAVSVSFSPKKDENILIYAVKVTN